MHDIDYRLVRDHDGDVVGQLKDHWVTDRQDGILGFVFGTGLYSLDGTHVGWCDGGRILDLDGCVLGTVQQMPVHGAGFPLGAAVRRPKVPKLKPRKPRSLTGGPSPLTFAALFHTDADLAAGYATAALLATRSAEAIAR
ncbi:hypothetical protein E4L96_19685 [Massilia arenosa]|uniref:4-fold beta flower domain-containing protein n=1 Tax=Zemynaea arenosa TaxID=2561931 RepID=A0A4Y9RZX0_9BURK|nr:hypothetical protein [Massilia arenosa]TFW13326.1 hypothetical protein E4L96_19685 [Massilia arenosa]